jgi:glycosyltransferase involved in cell wall biosynthesis
MQGRKLSDDKVVILYVGRISWEKNLRLLSQAYCLMDRERCHLVIVGDGPAYEEIQQEFADLEVTFTGYLRGEELSAVYASADIFAFPSYTETFGQVVLEAMASGLPVAGLLSEGVCDLVTDGRTGYLFDVNGLSEEKQVAGYQEQLMHLVNNHNLRSKMGKFAYLEAQKYSWYEAMKCIIQGYDEMSRSRQAVLAAS